MGRHAERGEVAGEPVRALRGSSVGTAEPAGAAELTTPGDVPGTVEPVAARAPAGWLPGSTADVDVVAALRDLRAGRAVRAAGRTAPGVPTGPGAGPARSGAPAPAVLSSEVQGAVPGRMAFSEDGSFWWDGARWQQLADSDAAVAPGFGAGSSRGRGWMAVGVITVLLVAAGATTHVAQRAQTFERSARVALVDGRAAQEAFRVEHDRYAADAAELASAGMPTSPSVSVEVLRAGQGEYCLGAGRPGDRPRWFATEAAGMSRSPCG